MNPLVDTLLVTGCGGDIAIAIARFVREDGLARRLVGADVRDDHPGFAFFDEVVRLPRADAPDYVTALQDMEQRFAPDAMVPMSEAELARLLSENWPVSTPTLLRANDLALATGLDKMETFRRLDAAGIGVPRSGIVGQDAPPSGPFIIKPRSGQGSKGLCLVEDWNRDHLTGSRGGDLWQEFLPAADQEFTCGLIALPGMGLRTITLRRQLSGGLTGNAEVVEHPAITAELARIAEVLELQGAINVQLRLRDGRPCVFEINPRFSSTVGFRHRLGFKDFQWSLEAAAGRPISPYSGVAPGTRMYRVGVEVIRPPSTGR